MRAAVRHTAGARGWIALTTFLLLSGCGQTGEVTVAPAVSAPPAVEIPPPPPPAPAPPPTQLVEGTDAPEAPAPQQRERVRTSRPPASVAPREPALLRIPAVGVQTPLVQLALNPDSSLEVPTDFSLAGWYTLGPAPGEAGPAIIAGHVDSRGGPAVFYRLGELRPGDRLEVWRGDGALVTFAVQSVERFPKDAFPTDRVYAPSASADLRLITCGGTFNRATGHYRDNVVVFATAV